MTEDFVLDAGRRFDVVTTGKCLDGLSLLFGERFRHIDRDVDDFIATLTTIAVDVGDALVLQPQHRSGTSSDVPNTACGMVNRRL